MEKTSPCRPFLALLLLCVLVGPSAGAPSQPADAALQGLQGTWQGFRMVRQAPTGPYIKEDPDSKITITVRGDSLHFYRDPDFWFETTIALPAGSGPQQLHATIKEPENSRGDVVISFFKIEGDTLTLGGIRDPDSTAELPKTFEEAAGARYELLKVEAPRAETP